MLKELILSTFLTCAIGVSSTSYDLTPNRQYTGNSITFNSISDFDMVDPTDTRFGGSTYTYQNYTITYNGRRHSPNNFPMVLNNYGGTSTYFDDGSKFSFRDMYSYVVDAGFEYFGIFDTTNFDFYYQDTDTMCFPLLQIQEYQNQQLGYRFVTLWRVEQDYNAFFYVLCYKGNWDFKLKTHFDNIGFDSDTNDIVASINNITTPNVATASKVCVRLMQDSFDYYCFSIGLDFEFDPNVEYRAGYDDGYYDGYNTGKQDGFDLGYNANNTLLGLFASIADVPINMLYSMFNFDLFGQSLLVGILGLLTLVIITSIVIFVIKKVL